jgi:hypothetical protein
LHEAVRLGTDLLCESATSRYSRRKISTDDELSGVGVARSIGTEIFRPGLEDATVLWDQCAEIYGQGRAGNRQKIREYARMWRTAQRRAAITNEGGMPGA